MTEHVDFKRKTILLVNTGSLKKKFILQRLKKLGLKIVCLNAEKNWAQPYVDHWIIANNARHGEALAAVEKFMSEHPTVKIDGALTFYEDDVLLASKITDRFKFIGIPFSVSHNVRNKFLFREFCKQHSLPTPQHRLIKNTRDINYVIKNFKFPLVAKPVYGSSSAYVIKIEDAEHLAATYEYIKENLSTDIESALEDGSDILVEEYIAGDEVDIDILIQNGKIKFYSISDNYKTREPFFVETGQSIPSSLPLHDQKELIDMAEMVLEKLGVQNGCIHFEAKSTKNGPVPIEINLRMGGDEVHSFVKGAWGVDLIEQAINIALGCYIKINKPTIPRTYIAGQYFLSDYSGVLTEFNIDEKIKQKSYLGELHFFKQVGDPILVPPEGYEYLGWITVYGDTPLNAQDNLKDSLKYIQYKVTQFDQESALGKTSRKNHFSAAILTTNKNKNITTKKEVAKKLSLKNQRNLHVGLVGNIYEDFVSLDKNIPLKTIWEGLHKNGYQVTFFNASQLPETLHRIKKLGVDIIFNACEEWIGDLSLSRSQITAALESLHLPITGSDSMSLAVCQNKILTKKILNFHNIPTPKWDYAYKLDDHIKDNLQYPLMIKPATGDNSFGITPESVVVDKKQRDKQIKKVLGQLKKPALIEEFIAGDEYEVSVLGNSRDDYRILPLVKSLFNNRTGIKLFNTNNGTWLSNSKQGIKHTETPARKIDKKLEALITEIALDTYTVLRCQDYGRVEIRVDEDDNPYVLELDPNPNLFNLSGIVQSAKLIGLKYNDLLDDIIRMTLQRFTK